jgi:serine/threonine protein phosphatase PrpC
LRIDYADSTLIGAREENQDRVTVAVSGDAALIVAVDGMGGHAEGARAAETTLKLLVETFRHTPLPVFDPLGFLHLTLGRAHEEVVKLGAALPLEHRPRATCAACLVQGDSAWWAHVGDSRVYHLRGGRVLTRTRDHSHVEFLLREGVISADQALSHPMRNFVECCVGGESLLPEMATSGRVALKANDVLLACTDGFWSGLDDPEIARGVAAPGAPLRESVLALASQAVSALGPASDNTSVAAVRWLGAA